VILILSACGASKQKLTDRLRYNLTIATEPYVPPQYVFVSSEDELAWQDAVVAWTLFYSSVIDTDYRSKRMIQDTLRRLHSSGFADVEYFRWDASTQSYRHFRPRGQTSGKPKDGHPT